MLRIRLQDTAEGRAELELARARHAFDACLQRGEVIPTAEAGVYQVDNSKAPKPKRKGPGFAAFAARRGVAKVSRLADAPRIKRALKGGRHWQPTGTRGWAEWAGKTCWCPECNPAKQA